MENSIVWYILVFRRFIERKNALFSVHNPKLKHDAGVKSWKNHIFVKQFFAVARQRAEKFFLCAVVTGLEVLNGTSFFSFPST